ncbi:major histocompatibility complex class I-related gene protein isoform X2 [Lates calcarifer]|uniref:Major histocompatibility complex class I-related gene protein isoform X2 n=1 Tax=Lates calcarifer TaxID=8187 RepID=A0AAJ7Q2N6_LATCA|nr:major histocompatibility complex class I-related gene protein isoform X2 [Lates calcarifer]
MSADPQLFPPRCSPSFSPGAGEGFGGVEPPSLPPLSEMETLRMFVNERLTAAVDDILELFGSVARYREQIDRQIDRQLDGLRSEEGRRSRAAVIHSLKHVYLASSEVQNFPDFVAVVFVDGIQTDHYDSNTKSTVPTQVWMNRVTADDPEYWKRQTLYWEGQEQIGRVNIETLKGRFNQTGGIHVIQVLNGCEWDDETGDVSGFGLISYDGEDILILDMKAQRWIATKAELLRTQHKWNNDKSWIEFMEHRLTQECPVRLKNSLDYGKSFVQRTDLPSVSLLQKTPVSPVTCHATGFYPDRAMMFWSRDGEELHEHVDHSEILHNHDSTFQMSVDLDLSLVKPEDWPRHECVFQLSGVKDDIITKLDPAIIKTNWVEKPSVTALPITLPAAAAVAIILVATGIIVYKKKKAMNPSDSPDNSTELSEKLNPPDSMQTS